MLEIDISRNYTKTNLGVLRGDLDLAVILAVTTS